MKWSNIAAETLQILSLPHSESSQQRAGLALVRATAELSQHIADPHHAHRILHRWLQRFDPESSLAHAASLATAWPPTVYPAWLAAYRDDEDACAALPPHILLLGLLLAMAPGRSAIDPAWRYLDAAALQLDVDIGWIESALGWVWGSATLDVATTIAQQLEMLSSASANAEQLVDDIRTMARQLRSERAADVTFGAARNRYRALLIEIARLADELGLERTAIQSFDKQLEAERFRLVVLGEFKRGKSSLINALLDQPGLLPVELLPCTAEIIAIRHEATPSFACWDSEHLRFEPKTRGEFYTRAGKASARASDRAQEVARWQLGAPASFLATSTIELVDTPGLNEDPLREHAARTEANRADAAIVVLEPSHLASLQDLGLLELLRPRIQDVIIVVNRADRVDETQWGALRAHIQHRLQERGIEIPDERIVFASATAQSPTWAAHLAHLRMQIESHLLQRCSGRKLARLRAEARTCAAQGRRGVEERLATHERELNHLNELDHDAKTLAELHEQAKREVEAGTEHLAQHEALADQLIRAFDSALPGMLTKLQAGSEGWTSQHSPITASNSHLNEVVKKAHLAMMALLAEWEGNQASRIATEYQNQQFGILRGKIGTLMRYSERTQGTNPESLFDDLKQRAIHESTPSFDMPGTGGASLRVGVTGVASLVGGYVVADVMLYYVLGAISGFLAAPLLVTAILLGATAFRLLGRDSARAWIRRAVMKKFRKGMSDKRNLAKIHAALTRTAREITQNLSFGFRDVSTRMLDELRYQSDCSHRKLDAKRAMLGHPEAVKQELLRFHALANELRQRLNELESDGDARRELASPTTSHDDACSGVAAMTAAPLQAI